MDKMKSTFTVGKWTITPTLCEINDGKKTIHLEPKSMDLLLLLANAKGELVSRKQIMDVVWKDRVVTEYALNNLISGLRKSLNDKQSPEAYIVTRPKLGYQLIAKVDFIATPSIATPSTTTPDTATPVQDSQANTTQTQSFHAIESSSNTAIESTKPGPASSYKQTNESPPRFYKISIFVFIITVLGTLYWWSTHQAEHINPSPSIAVLPFEVFDKDEDIGYFADGLAEEIIHQLTVVENLKVISRTSSFYFRDKDLPLTEIANKLDVAYVLEGSVRKASDSMRVTVQLIRAHDDTHIWSKVFTASEQNRFSIQHDISTEVAHSIDASFVQIPDDKRVFTPHSSEAYLRVLKGRKLNKNGTPDDLVKARDEFMMATLLEPNYADAYVDLGMTYLLLIQQKKLAHEDAIHHAEKAIQRALELNPDLASAYAAKGVMLQMNNEVSEAQIAFKKALELNPDLYIALINYANLFRSSSNYEMALTYYQKAKDVAPLSGAAQWGLGNSLLRLGRIEDAVKRYQSCVTALTNHVNCHYGYAYALRLSDKNEEADAVLEKIKAIANKDDYWFRAIMGFHNLWKGNFETSNALFEGMIGQFGLNNDIVLSMPILKLKLEALSPWLQRLDKLLQPDVANKARVAVHAGYAISAYYAQQCTPVITIFEKIIKHRYFMVEELEALINANNYLAMLAHCYQVEGRHEDGARIITISEDVLRKVPENSLNYGGFLYTMAQTAAVKGDTQKAIDLIEALQKTDWRLKWLVNEDPILRSLGTSNIVVNTTE